MGKGPLHPAPILAEKRSPGPVCVSEQTRATSITRMRGLAPILAGGIRLGDPHCVAHLPPPPLTAAELAIGATNQSMDAFDASPAATFVEDALVTRLARMHGF